MSGHDGRADVVGCEVPPGRVKALLDVRTAEDVLVEFGRTLRAEGDQPAWIAKRLWKPARVARAVELWRRLAGGRGTPTYRIVVRVLQERSFRRTDLRSALAAVVRSGEPRWRPADPAALELWVVEYARGKFLAGIRLSTAEMRQHGGRSAERTGALRPAVAAAMVALASEGEEGEEDRESRGAQRGGGRDGTRAQRSGERRGTLLDPCCGSGTIVAEARAVGWTALGRDIDPDAVSIARRNVRSARFEIGDARELPYDDASIDAVVSNLPFGRQYTVDDQQGWQRAVLAEVARVTRPGGRVVLLVPSLPGSLIPAELRRQQRYPLRLLGTKTTIWVLERR